MAMDRAQLPLNALRAFEAAARHLNITRAAAELCVSQGAVSQQVSLLENRLGVALFRRLPRGLALTDEGLVARENLVARIAIDRGIPLASTVGGGYGADTVALAERHVRAILTLGAAFAASG